MAFLTSLTPAWVRCFLLWEPTVLCSFVPESSGHSVTPRIVYVLASVTRLEPTNIRRDQKSLGRAVGSRSVCRTEPSSHTPRAVWGHVREKTKVLLIPQLILVGSSSGLLALFYR